MLPPHGVIADDDPVFSRCAANFHVVFVPFYFGLVSSRCVGCPRVRRCAPRPPAALYFVPFREEGVRVLSNHIFRGSPNEERENEASRNFAFTHEAPPFRDER